MKVNWIFLTYFCEIETKYLCKVNLIRCYFIQFIKKKTIVFSSFAKNMLIMALIQMSMDAVVALTLVFRTVLNDFRLESNNWVQGC